MPEEVKVPNVDCSKLFKRVVHDLTNIQTSLECVVNRVSSMETYLGVSNPLKGTEKKRCTWTVDEDGLFHQSCGEDPTEMDGTPSSLGFDYCPFCGDEILHDYEDI